MARILPNTTEIKDLAILLYLYHTEAAHRLIKLVDKSWRRSTTITEEQFLDALSRAILSRMPNVFAGGSKEERGVRKALIENLSDVDRLELENTFIANIVDFRELHELNWHSGGRWAKRFCSALGIHPVFAGVKNRNVVQSWEDVEARPPKQDLADFQKEMKTILLNMLGGNADLSRCMITLPTGAGKTRIAVEAFIEWMKPRFADQKYLIWITQSEELCEQAVECIKDVWKQQEYSLPLRLYRYYGGKRFDIEDMQGGVVVSTINQLYYRRTDEEFREIARSVGAIIVDEAHRSSSHMYVEVFKKIDQLLSFHPIPICGLTATPAQVGENMKERMGELQRMYFTNLITPTIPEQYEGNPIKYFRDNGYLSRPRFILVRTGYSYKLTQDEVRAMEREREFPSNYLERNSKNRPKNRDVVSFLNRLKEDGLQCIVYACTVEQAKYLSAELNKGSVVSYPIDAKTPRSIRREVVDMFRKGQLQFLVNYSVLTTGFDAPKTENIVICRPISSVVLYEQIIGRGLRGERFHGTPECNIYDFVDNIEVYGDQMAYHRFKSFWESSREYDLKTDTYITS